MKNSHKKGQFADRPKNKKHSLASYQFQSASTTASKMPELCRYFQALGMHVFTVREPLLASDCPFCFCKNSMLLSPESQAYRCTGCGSHGSGLVQLHAQLHQITPEQARIELERLAEVSL